jgi:uncharacterized protein YqeY
MIAFEQKLSDEMKEAMRSKDQTKLDCLRAMKSALKYKHVEKNQADVTEEDAFAVFNTMIKQRKDSAAQYEQFGKTDDAAKERREIEVISSFLPAQISAQELSSIVESAIKASGASGVQDLGKVMKDLKAKLAGRADMKAVTDLVKQKLSS